MRFALPEEWLALLVSGVSPVVVSLDSVSHYATGLNSIGLVGFGAIYFH